MNDKVPLLLVSLSQFDRTHTTIPNVAEARIAPTYSAQFVSQQALTEHFVDSAVTHVTHSRRQFVDVGFKTEVRND